MTPPEVMADWMERATDAEIAAWLEEAERQIKTMQEFAHQLRNVQAKRLALAWEARNP